MMNHPGLGALANIETILLRREVEALKAAMPASKSKLVDEWEALEIKLRVDANLTRGEVAMFLNIDPRTLRRMEKNGHIQRLPLRGTLVRFSARDVLRLASASSRKGA